MKIALACSHGGHLTQMQMLGPAFVGHEVILITYRCPRTENLSFGQRKYLLEDIGTNVPRMLLAFFQATRILIRERPDVVLSTGAEIAIPFLWIGKLLRTKTVYIESWSRIRTRSGTGPLVYPVADLFLVQWPSLLSQYGPKARYGGGIV